MQKSPSRGRDTAAAAKPPAEPTRKESDAPGRGALPGPFRVLYEALGASPQRRPQLALPDRSGVQVRRSSPAWLQRGYQVTVAKLTILC